MLRQRHQKRSGQVSVKRLPISGNKSSLYMALFYAVATVSLWEQVLLWVALLCTCSVIVRVSLYMGLYRHAPSNRTVNLLAILSALALAWFSVELGLLISMINLLIMSCSLKLMHLSRIRDVLQLFAAGLFVLGCGFIFSQSIAATVFYLALLLFLLLALYSLFSPSLPASLQAKRLAVMSAQALPIAAILFVLMPQLPPLWKMPASGSSSTGLSETLAPGDIANLIQSNELVFNASFDGPIPLPSQRYWRALTLEFFDGVSWQISQEREMAERQYRTIDHEFSPNVIGSAFSYSVIAEATGQDWLYGIDVAVPGSSASQREIWQTSHYQLQAEQALMSKRSYSVKSYPDTVMNQTLFTLDRRINLQLPEEGNPKTQQWVNRLRQNNNTQREFINAVLDYFRSQPFYYTLTPPQMSRDPVDAFMFEHQAGFCSHYASAMAYVLRLGGIPSRIITGYQGGENLTDNVLSVRQYDAHAWVEAYLYNRGWVKFDPTAIVAPQRIQQGLTNSFGEQRQASQLVDYQNWPGVKEVQLFLARMDYSWSKWVLGFDAQKQHNMLEKILGQLSPTKITLFVLGVLAIISALLLIYFVPNWQRDKHTEHLTLYLDAVNAVTLKTGFTRDKISARAYMTLVSRQLSPEAQAIFAETTQLFEQAEYIEKNKDVATKNLGQVVKKLKKELALTKS